MGQTKPLYLAVVIVLIILLVVTMCRKHRRAADRFTIEHATPMISSVDDQAYRVQQRLAGAAQAADAIAKINTKLVDLMRYLRQKYVRPGLGPMNDGRSWGGVHPARRRAVERILMRYNPDNFVENSPHDPSGDTSYVTDKGAIFAMCLRSKREGNELLDFPTLLFVALHELSHIAVDVIDHPKEFWSAFRFILEEAREAGIFTSPDYAAHPVTYCGLDINYSPAYDDSTPSI